MINNPKIFLEERLSQLVLKFQRILCRYEFHSLSDAHCIEIHPSESFDEIALKEDMADIMFAFYDMFPKESLVFITENDGFSSDGSIVVARGIEYIPSWVSLFDDIEDQVYIEPINEDEHLYIIAA